MTELERCPLVLVKPNLHVSCHCVCCKMYVEMCCSVSARASDDALHNAFEGRQPTVQGIVECYCGESCEIGAKKDVGTGTFCNAIVSNESCPNVLLVPCLPVKRFAIAWHVVVAYQLVFLVVAWWGLFGSTKLVMCFVESPCFKGCLGLFRAVRHLWWRYD